MVPLDGLAQGLDQLLAALPAPLARSRVAQRHAGPAGELLDRADEVDLLDLLDERDRVARLWQPKQ